MHRRTRSQACSYHKGKMLLNLQKEEGSDNRTIVAWKHGCQRRNWKRRNTSDYRNDKGAIGSKSGGQILGRARLVGCHRTPRHLFMRHFKQHCVPSLRMIAYKTNKRLGHQRNRKISKKMSFKKQTMRWCLDQSVIFANA